MRREPYPPIQKFARLGHRWAGSRDQLLNFGTPLSPERLKLDTPARALCVVHSMQPLPNYFGLLFRYAK